MPTIPTVQPTPIVHPVVELRRYRLHPGRRDELIELFDRELVETQEATGMQVVGQFRDLDRPDQFVWLRAFASMGARRRSLEAFYGGPVWARHGLAAASTMIDSAPRSLDPHPAGSSRFVDGFVHGAILGALLGTGVLTGRWYGAGRIAHLHVNILGWAGLTLLATLVFFGPTMVRTRIRQGADDDAAARWVDRKSEPALSAAKCGRSSPGFASLDPGYTIQRLRRPRLRLHFGRVIVHQLLGDAARIEIPLAADFGNRRNLCSRTGDEALGK